MLARIIVPVALLAVLAGARAPRVSEPARWPPTLVALDTPARPGSAQPQLSSSERGMILSWIEREGPRATLKFSERTDRGWSLAQEVASGSDWFVNWADVPSVIRLADGTLAAHWLQKSGDSTYAYDVRLSYSTDGGKTWAPAFTPHHDGTRTEHGFASLFQMPGAGLGLAWLDGRATAGAGGHDTHATGSEVGAMSIRFAAFDRTWQQVADMQVDDRVCDCCPTTAAVTAEGPIVAYRDRSGDETRDIYVSRFANGRWSIPSPVHEDGWRIAACPVNGPVLSARDREVAAAWFTGKNDEGHAYVAFSSDAGRSFGAPVRLDEAAALGRVDVELLPGGSAIATWIEATDRRAQFRARRVERDGARTAPLTIAVLEGSRAAGYPRLAMSRGELVFAWTDLASGQPRIRTAIAALR